MSLCLVEFGQSSIYKKESAYSPREIVDLRKERKDGCYTSKSRHTLGSIRAEPNMTPSGVRRALSKGGSDQDLRKLRPWDACPGLGVSGKAPKSRDGETNVDI